MAHGRHKSLLEFPCSTLPSPPKVGSQRNGKGTKTALTEDGPIRIEVPRDRDGSFQPLFIPEHERGFTGFDDTIVRCTHAK